MAWTAPRTWTTGEIVTKTILDAHVRDNLLETAPAKVTTAGDLVYATGANALARLGLGSQGQVLFSNNAANAPAYASSLVVSPNGEVSMVDTPAFLAYNSAADGNITGDGTIVNPVEFDTEVFDQGSDYNNTTDTFTAPVAGRYRFDTLLRLTGINAHTIARVLIATSNRSYAIEFHPQNAESGNSLVVVGMSCLADMDASDTAVVRLQVDGGGGGKVVGTDGVETFFSGQLEC